MGYSPWGGKETGLKEFSMQAEGKKSIWVSVPLYTTRWQCPPIFSSTVWGTTEEGFVSQTFKDGLQRMEELMRLNCGVGEDS